MQSPEQDNAYNKLKEEIQTVPDVPAIPEHIEKGGVTATPSQFTAQVADDNGNPLMQATPQTITLTVPASQEKLEEMGKGSITDAVTWFARSWLRMLKKAARFGWRVIRKN